MPRADLPTGTVTFLFTDIEGSTKLLHRVGEEAYDAALAGHRRILRWAFARHDGVEVDTQGDAFFVAFSDARAAVAAAMEAQQALARSAVRVRMGIHTGIPHVGDEGYVGADVHKTARIAAAGHGGQVLLSRSTRERVDAKVVDLGAHRLKDFPEPISIFQLGTEHFPPLKTISNTNLPWPVSSFVGRRVQVDEVTSLLAESRMVTLTGPGGSGKTRLALEVAHSLVSDFRNGVFWIGLASLREHSLVMDAIAQAVGAKDGLVEHLSQGDVLLVLDNFEQVVEAAPNLASVLSACPNVRILATSREVLQLQGEVGYPVPPLASSEAVDLFAARSRLQPDATIAELCRRLDDLPLAVELAAARARALTPAQILERLSTRLDLLKGGRDVEPRQRTLRATIAWSFDLLSEDNRTLLARLAVFAGGWTLDSAQAVTDADVEALQQLVDKSLIHQVEGRFGMLETIREFAHERLLELPEARVVGQRHADHFLQLAEELEPALVDRDVSTTLDRLDTDLGNLRAAMAWYRDEDRTDDALRLAATLGRFWASGGHVNEGRRWLESTLESSSDDNPRLRAKAHREAGWIAVYQNDASGAEMHYRKALALGRSLGDPGAIAASLAGLAIALNSQGDRDRATALHGEALRHYEAAGDIPGMYRVQHWLGELARDRADYQRGVAFLEQSIALARERGDVWFASSTMHSLADLYLDMGDPASAARLYSEVLGHHGTGVDERGVAYCLAGLSAVAAERGDPATAARLWGAVQEIEETLGVKLLAHERARYEARVAGPTRSHPSEVEAGRRAAVGDIIQIARSLADTAAREHRP